MKFTVNSEHKAVAFNDIHVGETFIDDDKTAFNEDEILMRVGLGGGGCSVVFDDDSEYEGAAVNLTTGEIFSYYGNEKVYRVVCCPINVKYI